jgi:hypothetical protein
MDLKFRTEVCLLTLAIALFLVAAFIYSYQSASLSWAAFPGRGLAFAFVGGGSVLMLTASVRFSKQNRETL